MAGPDKRDQQTWVVVELSSLGESKIDDSTLEPTIRRDLGLDEQHEIFIPAVQTLRNGRPVTVHLLEGYVFIASGLEDYQYLTLERRAYCSKVLTVRQPGGMRQLQVLPDRKIQELRERLQVTLSQDVRVGAKVRVQGGVYNNLEGKVVALSAQFATLHFSFRSAEIMTQLPRAILSGVE